jgi:hypothetical protein
MSKRSINVYLVFTTLTVYYSDIIITLFIFILYKRGILYNSVPTIVVKVRVLKNVFVQYHVPLCDYRISPIDYYERLYFTGPLHNDSNNYTFIYNFIIYLVRIIRDIVTNNLANSTDVVQKWKITVISG